RSCCQRLESLVRSVPVTRSATSAVRSTRGLSGPLPSPASIDLGADGAQVADVPPDLVARNELVRDREVIPDGAVGQPILVRRLLERTVRHEALDDLLLMVAQRAAEEALRNGPELAEAEDEVALLPGLVRDRADARRRAPVALRPQGVIAEVPRVHVRAVRDDADRARAERQQVVRRAIHVSPVVRDRFRDVRPVELAERVERVALLEQHAMRDPVLVELLLRRREARDLARSHEVVERRGRNDVAAVDVDAGDAEFDRAAEVLLPLLVRLSG